MKKPPSLAFAVIVAVLGVSFYQSCDSSDDIAAYFNTLVNEVVSGRAIDRVTAWLDSSADNPHDRSTPNQPAPSVSLSNVDASVSDTIARFTVDRSSRSYPNVIDYGALYNTPLEKYIPDMEKRYREIRGTNGVARQTMRARYANGGETVQFVVHTKLLPGWHNDDGLNEYDYVCFTWDSGDLSRYGNYQKYRIREFQDKLSFDSKKRLSTDNAYAQVVTAALRICDTTDYNWAGFSAYKGAKPKPTPGMALAVCAGYAKAGQSAFLNLDCVQSVENWHTSSHEWNVLNLTDGRRLYVDVTWFDNDHIDEKTGRTTYADDYNWANITFDEELFNYGEIAYGGGFSHASSSKQLASRVSR